MISSSMVVSVSTTSNSIRIPINIVLLFVDVVVCFPMGKGMYRVVHIPEDEAVLLNSREKAPYLICVEVLKGEAPRYMVLFARPIYVDCSLSSP